MQQAPPPPPRDGSTPSQATTLIRLQVACAGQTPASLMAAHMSLSCAGRLRAATVDGVVLEIPNPPDRPLEKSTAAVTFISGESGTSFVSSITDVRTNHDGAALVTLAIPETLSPETRRQAVRISVPADTVEAALVGEGELGGPVRPVDISLRGILIALDESRADALQIGAPVELRLRMEQVELLVQAKVRRRDGNRFGLLFAPDGQPPEGMEKIMWKLQLLRMA